MTHSSRDSHAEHDREVPLDAADALLADLRDAERQLQSFRAGVERQRDVLRRTQAELAAAQENGRRLARGLDEARAELQHAREGAEAARRDTELARARAERLAETLRTVGESVAGGDVYSLILRSCIALTGATRGLYVTARAKERMRVRAAMGIDGYPAAPPSDFICALCKRALQLDDTFVSHDEDAKGLPAAERPEERFRNFAVAPVVLLKNFDGILVVADKRDGEFNEDDIETLLAVGSQAKLAVENARLQHELHGAYLSTVSMLADAVQAKDAYTHGHSETVSRLARLVAQQMNLSDYDRRLACYAALLHDVGKIGVSDGVLNKPGPLLPEEVELVRSHVRVGYDLLRSIPALAPVAEVVLHHHEWYDGTGYPDHLRGDQIPVAARIVAAVDAYCAMVDRRSYKEPFSFEKAREELLRCAGTQFDPKVIEALLGVLGTAQAADQDDDVAAECEVLPGFDPIAEQRKRMP